MAPTVIIVIGVITAFIAQEIFGWFDYLAKWLVRRNAKRVPSHLRARCEEEWLADLNEVPGRIAKLLFAIDTFRASSKITHDYFLPGTSHWVPFFIRIIDFTFTLIAYVLMAPIISTVAMTIKIYEKGPIFFDQEIVGRYNSRFSLRKFNTMSRTGFFLRKYNIDYLPIMINVLKGDMSLVGPSPLRPNFAELAQENIQDFNCRHHVRPGVTGWAQVHSSYGDQAFEYDKYFVENLSLRLYFKTLWLTVVCALRTKA